MPHRAMHLTPLLSVSRTMKQSIPFLLGGLLLSIPVICCIDLLIFLLLLLCRPLVMCLKEPSLGV
jgi:hypothetical protein